jgi:hypothetical protein
MVTKRVMVAHIFAEHLERFVAALLPDIAVPGLMRRS